MSNIQTILVDLLPLLPGGANGGAKIIVIELLRGLSRLYPQVKFVLLTRKTSHDELAALDSTNVSRILFWDDVGIGGRAERRLELFSNKLIHRLPARIKFVVDRLRQLVQISDLHEIEVIEKVGADILYRPFGLASPFRGEMFFNFQIPTVTTIYDLQHKDYPQFFNPEELQERERNFHAHCETSTIATISDFVRDTIIKNSTVDERRVKTVHIRIDKSAILNPQHNGRVLTRLGLSVSSYLLYPANYWAHKNHEMLFTAFAMARNKGLDEQIKLVCSGSPGPRNDALVEAAEALGLGDAIVFPGYLKDDEFAVLLRSSLGLIYPSLYEGFGMPIIEAMAAGTPVACSNCSSLPEIAGDVAILFDPRKPDEIAQAMHSLVTDNLQRIRLIESGRRRAKQFDSTDDMVREYWQLFEYALERWRNEVDKRTSIDGIYSDGWASALVMLQFGKGEPDRWVEMQLEAPAWLPVSASKITVTGKDGRDFGQYNFSPGTTPTFNVTIGPELGFLKMRIASPFQPARILAGNADTRNLTVLVRSLSICSASADPVKVFSGTAPQ